MINGPQPDLDPTRHLNRSNCFSILCHTSIRRTVGCQSYGSRQVCARWARFVESWLVYKHVFSGRSDDGPHPFKIDSWPQTCNASVWAPRFTRTSRSPLFSDEGKFTSANGPPARVWCGWPFLPASLGSGQSRLSTASAPRRHGPAPSGWTSLLSLVNCHRERQQQHAGTGLFQLLHAADPVSQSGSDHCKDYNILFVITKKYSSELGTPSFDLTVPLKITSSD